MPRLPTKLVAIAVAAGATACSMRTRAPDEYRDDTQALVETKRPEIKSCYDSALKSFPTTGGSVTVRFVVQSETGKVVSASVDEARSTAPPALRECVLRAIDGLVLAPGDGNEGQATFVWQFRPAAASASPVPAT
jgi:hypothetical protein